MNAEASAEATSRGRTSHRTSRSQLTSLHKSTPPTHGNASRCVPAQLRLPPGASRIASSFTSTTAEFSVSHSMRQAFQASPQKRSLLHWFRVLHYIPNCTCPSTLRRSLAQETVAQTHRQHVSLVCVPHYVVLLHNARGYHCCTQTLSHPTRPTETHVQLDVGTVSARFATNRRRGSARSAANYSVP